MPIVAQDRYHAFDAVRAFALLAGIVQHGSMSFVAVSSPVQDVSQSWILSVTYYVIHIFRMGLFFMIAGFFARILLYRRGTRAFVQDRLMRIFVPMVVGWCIFGTVLTLQRQAQLIRSPRSLPLVRWWLLIGIRSGLASVLIGAGNSFSSGGAGGAGSRGVGGRCP